MARKDAGSKRELTLLALEIESLATSLKATAKKIRGYDQRRIPKKDKPVAKRKNR
jgi:hypothetical protein